METQSKREYQKAIKNRYRTSDKKTKSIILNEFCSTCRYNRKYAIRILNRPIFRVKVTLKKKR